MFPTVTPGRRARGYVEVKLALTDRQKRLFERWKHVKLESVKARANDCATMAPRDMDASIIDRLKMQEKRIKAAARDLQAEIQSSKPSSPRERTNRRKTSSGRMRCRRHECTACTARWSTCTTAMATTTTRRSASSSANTVTSLRVPTGVKRHLPSGRGGVPSWTPGCTCARSARHSGG